MMCSAATEHDVPFGYDARLRLMMCASRMSGTHRIIATKGTFLPKGKNIICPTGQTSFIFDVWLTNVLLAPFCDKKPAEIRIIFLTSAGFD